ncbi:MAG: choice-of-anchor V domain-containing protein [Planctomycetota bacterium]
MHKTPILLCAASALALTSWLLGHGAGTIPGAGIGSDQIPANVTTAFPSCGKCHGAFPGGRGAVSFAWTGPLSLSLGQASTHSLTISSIVTGGSGGFALTTDKGTFQALANTNVQTGNNGTAVTHTTSATRSWSFQFASKVTGLVQWFAAGNTVNADGQNTGDSWGWFGTNPSTPGTPYRLFVNDSQVTPIGTGCVGDKGFVPIVGAATNATLGQTFNVELHNAPPQTAAIFALGFSDQAWGPIPLPFDLGLLGMTGCKLWTSLDLLLPVPTGGSKDGEGTATLPFPVPNQAQYKGQSIFFTALVLDKNANNFGMSAANGIKAVLQ